ncbi:MAG: ankyrin repeat domain-containing protein [Capsulimonadaceae bacterium]|nr:ankyrin repeat domain-containing protein [Capsulimonadaceae bacterium]
MTVLSRISALVLPACVTAYAFATPAAVVVPVEAVTPSAMTQTAPLVNPKPKLSVHDIALVQAGRDADLEAVKIQLSAGARINSVDGAYTALTGAVSYGNFTLVAYLLSRGADPNLTPPNSPTPLAIAVESGAVDLADALIHGGAKVNLAGALGETPLMRAAIDGNLAMTRLLIRRGARIDQINASGATALFAAADANHPSVAAELIAKGANVNASDSAGFTPLIVAAAKARYETVKLLIDLGAKVDAATNHGETALMHAVAAASPSTTQLLVTGKANVNARDSSGRTALMHAILVPAKTMQARLLSILLQNGATPDAKNDSGQTALMYACAAGRVDSAMLLLDKGANAGIADNLNADALLYLAGLPLADIAMAQPSSQTAGDVSSTEQKVAQRLAAAPTERAGERNADALCVAAGTGRIGVVRGILDAGASVNTRADKNLTTYFPTGRQNAQGESADWPVGVTPLIVATAEGKNDIVRELIQRGADVSIAAQNGQTAADFAKITHHDVTAQVLHDAALTTHTPTE